MGGAYFGDTSLKVADIEELIEFTKVGIENNKIITVGIANAAVTANKLSYEIVSITVLAAASSGEGACTAGSIIIGYYPTGNQDQFVDNIAVTGIGGAVVTITLAAAATANNTFNVILLKV